MKKPVGTKTKNFQRSKKRVVLGLIVLLLGIYFFIYKPVVAWQDKKRFEKAAVSLEELYAGIESKIGKPNQIKRDKSCRYASAKFERGTLSCKVVIYLLYENTNKDNANQLMFAVTPLINTPLRDDSRPSKDTEFIDKSLERSDQHFSQAYNSGVENIRCSVEYIYPPVFDSFEVFKSSHSENLKVSLFCGDYAKAEHYPVED